jgi:NADP-dependent 3-hydroxy acid dehydrogenase YdfG
MKIAVTGHSSGIGQAFANVFTDMGHEVVGLSRRNGNNIRSQHKILPQILECDMFVNNAQEGFVQTELLYAVWNEWKSTRKTIWCIGSICSQLQQSFYLKEYQTQKQALDCAFNNCRSDPDNRTNLCMIRPGVVATQDYNAVNHDSCDAGEFAKIVVATWNHSRKHNIKLESIELGFRTADKVQHI